MQFRSKGGGWFTHVRAAEIFTVGIGGDSRIYMDLYGNINVGPEKSMPLSLAVNTYPDLKDEIKFIYDKDRDDTFTFRITKHMCWQKSMTIFHITMRSVS